MATPAALPFPDAEPEALKALMRVVQATGYRSTTVTPATRARV